MEKIKYPLCRYFILFVLSFLGETIWPMNPTHQDGWRVRNESPIQSYQRDFYSALASGKTAKIKSLINTGSIPLNEPWVIAVNQRKSWHYYPIEYVIFSKWPASSLEALLEAGSPVNGFSDYNPLKDIFMRLNEISVDTKNKGFFQNKQVNIDQKDIDLYIDYIKILLRYNANIDLPFPAHNGFAKDTLPDLISTTAREFAQNLKLKLPNSKDVWNKITGLFNQEKSPITAPSPSPTDTPQQGKSSSVPSNLKITTPTSTATIKPAAKKPTTTTVNPALSTPSDQPNPSQSSSTSPSIANDQGNQSKNPSASTSIPNPPSTATAAIPTSTSPSGQPNTAKSSNTPTSVTQGQGAPSVTAIPSPSTSASVHNPPAPASAHQKSTWYNKTTTFFADKTACAAVAITAVMLAAMRLMYKNLISTDNADLTPVTITVTNNTGSTIHVVMYNSDETVKTTKLIDGAETTLNTYWSAPVYVLSGSATQKSRTPLSISLAHYKIIQTSELETVHISITKASFFQRWLSGSLYTYCAQ